MLLHSEHGSAKNRLTLLCLRFAEVYSVSCSCRSVAIAAAEVCAPRNGKEFVCSRRCSAMRRDDDGTELLR